MMSASVSCVARNSRKRSRMYISSGLSRTSPPTRSLRCKPEPYFRHSEQPLFHFSYRKQREALKLDCMIKKLTPVLVVEAIEPVLPLWDALGFQRTAEVPHGERLGFVIVQSGAAELMYQSLDSVRADEPRCGQTFGRAGLLIEVD